MDFFDNAVNKTKEAIDVVCKKTNEVVNTQKQRFDVANLESKREKDFAALGKIYFETIKDEENFDESTGKIVAEIKEKSTKIDDLYKEILDAKNKRICPSCGAKIDVESVFCNICGAKVIFVNNDNN